MDAHRQRVAEACLAASYEGARNFPAILGELAGAGFEGYLVDYRRGRTTYFLPDGDSVDVENQETPGTVEAVFMAEVVEANVRKSQAGTHSYVEFCKAVKAAGCAGYIVSLLGRRVTYFGRTGETHVELMPS